MNKKDKRGIVIRNKARLVAQGHTQEEGIDYDEVVAPVGIIEVIRLFLAYASLKDFVVYQMDVKSDFLYEKIKKEVYVCQPPGFKDPDFPGRVYKVEKTLYGLHQAPRAWFETLSKYLLENGFQRGKIDKTLFIKRHKEVKNASTPMETQKPLLKDEDGEEVDVHMYRSMIGSLMYVTSLRPDIIFAERSSVGDEEGVDCLPAATIFEQLALKGYEKVSQKLTFYKPFFSPQWKFLIHTILQCLSPKTTAWNEFSSIVASAIKCLATNQKFNFSKMIFDSMSRNLDNISGKFLMYPRFKQVFLDKQLDGLSNHERKYDAPSHTKRIFGNMRRVGKGFSGNITPLFPKMMVQNPMGEGSAIPTDPQHTPTILQPSTSQPQKTQKHRKPRRKDTQVPQLSVPTKSVADEAFYKELDDRLVRVATIASNLEAEQDSGNINKTQSKATPNESSSQGTDSGGGPSCQEAIGNTIAQTRSERVSTALKRVLDLEKTKTTQALEINSLKIRVKKLKKKQRSRIHKLKRLYKGRKIHNIDADKDITLVNDQDDRQMFDVTDLQGEEEFVQKDVAGEVNAAIIATTDSVATTMTVDEVTLAQALMEIKKELVKLKKKDQIMLDEEVSLKLQAELQAEFDKEQRLASKKAQQEEEANIALIETWDDVQAKIDADYKLAERLQAEEQQELNDAEKATLPPTRAQQRSIMCTYLKNMEGWKPNSLKNKSFANIQELFDKAMKKVNTFVDYRTELVEASSKKAEAEVIKGSSKRAGTELEQESLKRAGTELEQESLKRASTELEQESSKRAGPKLEQESSKKQKIDDDKEIVKLKQLVKIIPDEEGVAIDVVHLVIKPSSIVDWKSHKEGKKGYYKIIRANGSLKIYLVFRHMLKSFNREDVKTLCKLVKAKHGSSRPEKDYERVL
nr:ribonuclease H-like domain-containing protein [Tanacetum cinerariifolium]